MRSSHSLSFAFSVAGAAMLSLGVAEPAAAAPESLCANYRTGQLLVAERCPVGTKKQTLGVLLTRAIPKGATVYGVIGGRYVARGGEETYLAMSSLPARTTPVFDEESDIQVTNTAACAADSNCLTAEESDVASTCTGTAANPTAPKGKVCIYPVTRLNAKFLVGFHVLEGANGNAPAPASFSTGFRLGWESESEGETSVEAVWAYTAP